MAMGSIELGTIVRSQDYTTIKQNEDNKSVSQQNVLIQDRQKEDTQKTRQVNQSDDAQWQQKKFDARDKGSGSYEGDGGSRRKKEKEPDGKVVLKGPGGFDIKI